MATEILHPSGRKAEYHCFLSSPLSCVLPEVDEAARELATELASTLLTVDDGNATSFIALVKRRRVLNAKAGLISVGRFLSLPLVASDDLGTSRWSVGESALVGIRWSNGDASFALLTAAISAFVHGLERH